MKRKLLLTVLIGILCFIISGCSSSGKLTETNQGSSASPSPSAQGTPAAGIADIPATGAVPASTTPDPVTTASGTPAFVTPVPAEGSLTEKEFTPSEENVKLLGRTYLLGSTLWLSYSASGIEFTFTGTKAVINLVGDNVIFANWAEGHYCRVGVYVNDELVADELMKEKDTTITAFESDKEQTVTIRVIKLSEANDSTVGIGKIKVVSTEPIKPTEAKAHRIEFIGDSITCGFGVDDNVASNAYTTATENAVKTYSYKTAQALDADYSMVAMSGYGIVSGYTPDGKQNPGQVMPKFYETMGSSYGYFNSMIQVNTINWDFSHFVPELIVINLGTNDNSYTGNDTERQAEFAAGYTGFLKQVREKNPDSTILCTLGIMGYTLYPSIEDAVSKYSAETGDVNIYTLQLDMQQESDGYGAGWHPSEKTHTKAAEKLTEEINKIMGW